MGLLINIDNGGTFTDACVSDGSRIITAKSPTTPHDLTICFVDVLRQASALLYGEEDLPTLIRDTERLRYSTTSGTNAIVERKGLPVGVIVEAGEEASLYGAAADWATDEGLWGSMIAGSPESIATDPGGDSDPAQVTAAVNKLLGQGAHRIVLCLASPEAERAAKATILDRFPRHLLGAVPVLFSFELSGDRQHGRRLATAVLNAFLHPTMENFLYGAEAVVRRHHMRNPLLIFRNDGGSARVAKTTALKTYSSGPAGGLEGTAAYARHYEAPTVVSLDVGGTTTDFAVIEGGKARALAYGRAGGLPFSFSMGEVDSIGAGGSSILQVKDGQIAVGPESVGASPGPACFGRGGTHATLTDVLVLAGIIDPDRYLGGTLTLDKGRAEAAVIAAIAEPLGLSLPAALAAASAAYEEKVATKTAEILKARKADPASATLISFGGAGPMNACSIAARAGIKRVIVPHLSAVFSAYGIGFSDLGQDYFLEAEDIQATGLDQATETLMDRAKRDMFGEGVEPREATYAFSEWSETDGIATLTPLAGGALKAGSRLHLNARYDLAKFTLATGDTGAGQKAETAGDRALTLDEGGTQSVPLIDPETLAPGIGGTGPALVSGGYLTCFIPSDWRFSVTANNDLLLEAAQ
ncbi:MAG: hydantoinase/oxoprolinase family protein [Pseudomonadota bacterium]